MNAFRGLQSLVIKFDLDRAGDSILSGEIVSIWNFGLKSSRTSKIIVDTVEHVGITPTILTPALTKYIKTK